MVVIDNPDPNSMWPTYYQGDLFVLHDSNPSEIALGDVIVYEKANKDKIIHRVIDIIISNAEYYFRVKGDNPLSNPSPDSEATTLIHEDSVLGKIAYRIPYLGHLSLAMQRNAGIQLFVYFIAVLLGLAIVFWPESDEDKDKEDETFDLSIASAKSFVVSIVLLPKQLFVKFSTRKQRLALLAVPFTVLVLLIAPIFVPSLLGVASTPTGIGVSRISAENFTDYNESVNGQEQNYLYAQVKVTLFDNEGYWKRITGFTLEVFTEENNPNSRVSLTEWVSLRDFKGYITVGASIVIDIDDAPVDNSSIYFVVTLKWKEYFSEKSREFYADTIYQSL